MSFSASFMYRLRDKMTPEIKKISRESKKMSKDVAKDAKSMAKSFNEVGRRIGDTGKQMTMMGAAITAPLALATREAMKFNKGVAELSTLMPEKELKQVREEMNDTLLNIAKDFGSSTDDVVKSAYQAVSAGIKPTQEAVDEFLRIASQASIGGVTTLETAVDGMTSVMNAYRSHGLEATQISDEMFTAVRLGKTTFEELSASLFNVVPTASSLGIKFGEVTSALATMTAQGVPTNVATTQLRAMFTELGREGTKVAERFQRLSGKSFPDFIKEGGSVGEALNMLQKHAERNNLRMMDMFSNVRAGQGAMALAGENAEAYAKALKETENATGATGEAFKKMAEDESFQFNQMLSSLRVSMIELGQTLVPIVTKIGKAIKSVVDVMIPWIRENQTLVKVVLSAVLVLGVLLTTLGTVGIVAGMIVKGVGAMITVFGALKVAFLVTSGAIAKASAFLVATPFGAILLAVAGVALAVWQIYKNWDIIVEGLSKLWKKWSDFVVNTINRTAEYWGEKIFNMVEWFKKVGDLLSGIWSSVANVLKKIFLGYVMFLKGTGSIITGIFGKIWGAVRDSFKFAWDSIGKAFIAYVVTMRGIGERIKDFFAGIWEGVKNSFVSVWENIKGLFIDGIKFLVNLLPDFVKDRLGLGGEFKVIEERKESVAKASKVASKAESAGGLVKERMSELSSPKGRDIDVNVKNDVGGTLKIEIDSKGVGRIKDSKPNGNLGYQVGG